MRRGSHFPAKRQCAANRLTQDVSSVKAADNSDGPLLPLTIPVERNGHRAEPRTQQSSYETAVCLVQRCRRTGESRPGARVDSVNVEEWEKRENGDVGGAEEGMRYMRQEGGAEEDQDDVDGRRDKDCEEEGKEYSLRESR